jgi:hypothetical protein
VGLLATPVLAPLALGAGRLGAVAGFAGAGFAWAAFTCGAGLAGGGALVFFFSSPQASTEIASKTTKYANLHDIFCLELQRFILLLLVTVQIFYLVALPLRTFNSE